MLLCIVATSLLHIISHYYSIITSLLRHYYKLIIQRGNHVKTEPFPLSPIITHYYIIITKGHHYYLINILGDAGWKCFYAGLCFFSIFWQISAIQGKMVVKPFEAKCSKAIQWLSSLPMRQASRRGRLQAQSGPLTLLQVHQNSGSQWSFRRFTYGILVTTSPACSDFNPCQCEITNYKILGEKIWEAMSFSTLLESSPCIPAHCDLP